MDSDIRQYWRDHKNCLTWIKNLKSKMSSKYQTFKASQLRSSQGGWTNKKVPTVKTNYEAENMKELLTFREDIIGDDLIDVFNNLQGSQRVCNLIMALAFLKLKGFQG